MVNLKYAVIKLKPRSLSEVSRADNTWVTRRPPPQDKASIWKIIERKGKKEYCLLKLSVLIVVDCQTLGGKVKIGLGTREG